MLIRLGQDDDRPLYLQIADAIRRSLALGELAVGDRLPAARTLADALDVNMHTVLKAYAELRNEGTVTLRRGLGAMVADPASRLARLRDLLRELAAEAGRQGVSQKELTELLAKEMR